MLRRSVVNLAVLLLVVLWAVPTLGLLLSSVRDRDQILTSGWWQSFSAAQITGFVRTGTVARQQGDAYVIDGTVLTDGQRLIAWGLQVSAPAAFPPEATAPIGNGWQITVARDGSYRMTSATPDLQRGVRIFVTTAAPPEATLENYRRVLTAERLGRAFANTVLVTIPATVLPILIAAFAAYALVWMPFPGRAILMAAILCLMIVPLQMVLIPLLRLYHQLGIGIGYLGIWLAHTGFGLPLAVFLLRNSMAGLPREVIESARLDGASEQRIFRDIALPLSFPALASLAIFQFMWVWNDLLVATVFLGNSRDQLVMTGLLRELMGSQGGEWDVLAASAFVSMIVPLVVFFALQKHLVRGLLEGAVKGG